MTKRKTNAELADEIWDSAQPITGTLAEIYLGSRGISPPDPTPDCLRFSPKLTHSNGQFLPAMIAQPTNPNTGEPIGGIQRTFLACSGKDKAQVEKNQQKMSLGPTKGGVIRLAEPSEGEPLILGEGVETVLTAMEATGLPGWATMGTSGLNLDLPDTVTEVILLAENDGGPNEKALNKVLPALIERGVQAVVARPPSGLKDFNDLVNGKSGHLPEAGRALVKEAIEAARKSEAVIGREDEAENDPEDDEGRFSLTKTGLCWRNSRGKNTEWQWIAQPFEIIGWTRDAADALGQTGDWGKLIRFKNSDGVEIERVVPLTSLHGDAGALVSSLSYWGMDIKCTPTARRRFAEFLAAVDIKDRVTVVHHSGWLDIGGTPVFALAERDHQQHRQGAGGPGEAGRRCVWPAWHARGLERKRRRPCRLASTIALLDLNGARGNAVVSRRIRERVFSPLRQVERGQDDLSADGRKCMGLGRRRRLRTHLALDLQRP
jgi:hypothetical protein